MVDRLSIWLANLVLGFCKVIPLDPGSMKFKQKYAPRDFVLSELDNVLKFLL